VTPTEEAAMTWTSVPFDPRAAGMLSVADALALLAPGDALGEVTFSCGDEGLRVVHGKDWFAGELTGPAPVWLTVPGAGRFQLTHQAAKQLGSTGRANKRYQEFVPPRIISDAVNYAMREGLGERALKLLTYGDGADDDGVKLPLAVALCRDTITPFSDVKLLETVLACVRARFGDEAADSACVDFKFWRDLDHTSFRVVIPVVQTILLGTGEEDAWCYGVEVRNSLTAQKQTMVSGYALRFATSAGALDLEHASGGFARRGSTPEDAYAWTAESCREIFGGVQAAFAGLQELVKRPLVGDYSRFIRQLFRENSVEKEQRLRVATSLEDYDGDLTMYALMNTAAEAANLPGLGWRQAVSLMEFAGDVLHRQGGMCDGSLKHGCRRPLPEDWDAAEAE
jgi:hypothetical protein